MNTAKKIALLDLAPRDDVFYGDGALRRIRAALEALGHAPQLWRSVLARHEGGETGWHADVTSYVRTGDFDVVVVARAWDASVIASIRAGMRDEAALVRTTDGVRASLDDAFDHVLDHEGLLTLVAGDVSPSPSRFTKRSARDVRERMRQLPRADAHQVEHVGGRPAISGPNSGCPYMRDARELAVFAALDLDTQSIQTKGCTFCLDQTGAYVDVGRDRTVAAWIAALEEVRRESPSAREILLTDERPHPNLPALFEALITRPALHGIELLVKSRVDWLLEFAQSALEPACIAAEATGSVLHVYLVGFESFDETHLALFNKGVTVPDNIRAIEVLRALEARFPRSFEFRKLRAHGFVAFTPWTTPETLIENARAMREVGFDALRSEAHRTRLRLYPRTPLHALAARDGLLVDAPMSGRGDRAEEQGYDASAHWRFRDARTEAVFEAASALVRADSATSAADALELASRYLIRFPSLAAVPGDAHLPLMRTLGTWPLRPSEALTKLGAAAVLDVEIETILAGAKQAALKELVPASEVDGLVRAYRAMGLASECVERHDLDDAGNRHAPGDSRAIVAVASTEACLRQVVDRQRARDVSAMGGLMGYPACCVRAFEAQTDRGDNMENERLAFRRAPRARLHPLLRRLGPMRLVSHHPCAPDCAKSIAGAEAFLDRIAELEPRTALSVRASLERPVLALDHSRTFLLDGAWTGDVFAFTSLTHAAPTRERVPEGARALRLSRTDVAWLDAEGHVLSRSRADRPLLLVPNAPVCTHAFEAMGGRMLPPLRWIELTPDYRCNNRCVGCFSVDDDGPSMSSREAVAALVKGRKTGASWLWLGGGEPTIRRDLIPLVREAKRIGYDRIRLQTNGMMLAYEDFAKKCADAGITEVSLSIKGASAETHDALARTPGCFDLLVRGAQNAAKHGMALEADVLVYASNAHEIPDIVRVMRAHGVERFRMWLLSSASSREAGIREQMPRIRDVMPHIVAAMDRSPSSDAEHVVSLHTPACTIPASHRRAAFDPAALALLVVNPGGHELRLETSPIEGGVYLPSCDACVARPACGGLRQDYIDAFGVEEFVPIRD